MQIYPLVIFFQFSFQNQVPQLKFIAIHTYMYRILSCVWLFVTPWTVACQASLPMGFSRQNCWSSCHFPLQGIFPTQGLNPCVLRLLHWQADSFPLHHLGSPACVCVCVHACMLSHFSHAWDSDPMDYTLQASSVCGISQARILEWVAISFSGDLPNPGIEPTSL